MSTPAIAPDARRPRIVCVDDEPQVLQGLSLNLRRRYEVLTATSGIEALALLERERDVSVVVCDMRMPAMNGATFLSLARERAPNATRVLLTGHAELESAISAVNDGQIFRFLTKPCAPPALLATVDAAAEQNRLVLAERELLENTLHGSIKLLTDILSLTKPSTFGRASGIKQLVSELSTKLWQPKRWQVEVAAMVSQLGAITLPDELVEKAYYGQPLTADEQALVDGVPAMTQQLLANIPRLEPVRAIISLSANPTSTPAPASDPAQSELERAAHILKVVTDFDVLQRTGNSVNVALDTMRGRKGYDPAVLKAFIELRSTGGHHDQIVELPLSALRIGMVFLDDVKMTNGTLLVPGGHEVTAGLIERVRNFAAGSVREPVRVVINRASTS